MDWIKANKGLVAIAAVVAATVLCPMVTAVVAVLLVAYIITADGEKRSKLLDGLKRLFSSKR